MLTLPATLTLREAQQTLRALLGAAGDGDTLRVDAGALQQFDTAALAVLLECSRAAGGRGLAVVNAPPKLKELARLYGVDGLLGLQ